MREFDRDLIRGGHYGQRSYEPRQKAGHMAAPTNAAKNIGSPRPGKDGATRPVATSGVGGGGVGSGAGGGRANRSAFCRQRSHSLRVSVSCARNSSETVNFPL